MVEAVVRLKNVNSFVITENEELKLKLWQLMRHRERNYFHSTLYKRRLWDGYTNFFDKATGKFLTGLLPEIETALKYWGVDYTVLDERGEFKFSYNKVDNQFLNQWLPQGSPPFILYDYQTDLINQLIRHKRGIVQAPTSSGKSAILLGFLHALPANCPTLICTNTKSLIDQIYKDAVAWGVPHVGRLYDKYEDPNIVTCATFQSLHKIEKLLPKIKALAVDEVHLAMSRIPKNNYNKMTNCVVRVGISATPFKFGGKDRTQKLLVKGYFGPVMKSESVGGILTTSKLQERDILSGANVVFYPIDQPKIPFHTYMDAVSEGIAENIYFHKIVVRLVESLKGRTLILVERIAHGDALNNLIPGSLWVQGKDNLDTRNFVIDSLKHSKNDVVGIATSKIFDTGINLFLHQIVNCASGQADHQIIQRMGRGLRTADDKDILNYYDFVFNINDYLYDHAMKRIKVLKAEGHHVVIKDEIDF